MSIMREIKFNREADTVGQVTKWKAANLAMMYAQQGQQQVTAIKRKLSPDRGPSSAGTSILASRSFSKGAIASIKRSLNIQTNVLAFPRRNEARCTWPGCAYETSRKGNVIAHIRTVHFKLPATKKRQAELDIVDDRNPYDYLETIMG